MAVPGTSRWVAAHQRVPAAPASRMAIRRRVARRSLRFHDGFFWLGFLGCFLRAGLPRGGVAGEFEGCGG